MTEKEEFIRVGTTLYKIVNQPRIDGGYVRKRIAWNSETLRQDYGKDARLLASQGGEVAGPESGAGVLEAGSCIQFAFLHDLPI